jgi:hypothetical protein
MHNCSWRLRLGGPCLFAACCASNMGRDSTAMALDVLPSVAPTRPEASLAHAESTMLATPARPRALHPHRRARSTSCRPSASTRASTGGSCRTRRCCARCAPASTRTTSPRRAIRSATPTAGWAPLATWTARTGAHPQVPSPGSHQPATAQQLRAALQGFLVCQGPAFSGFYLCLQMCMSLRVA